MKLGVAAAVVEGMLVPGDVTVQDGIVTAVGSSPAGPHGLAVPGFVDVQVNGFAGVDVLSARGGDYATMGRALAATGVTAYQPTLITAAPETQERALREIAAAGDRPGGGPRLLGAHLEGPFLSRGWPGAHPAAHLRDPDPALVARLRDAGPVTAITLAPELPGALELIDELTRSGVAVHLGHTDGDAATCHTAFDAGARALTHVHNAHRRFAPRDPGPAGVALTRNDVTVTAIIDGVHLAPETERLVALAAGVRLCLITDAIAAAGRGDGTTRIGELAVEVRDGVARLADGRLAGSVTTMDASVRRLVAHGIPLTAAVGAATVAPARLTGNRFIGRLAVGLPADIAVLDDDQHVARTLVGGDEAFAA